jgi:hypothetical protein
MPDEVITVGLTKDEKRRIRAAAGRRDMSMSEFGRDVITDWLDDNAGENRVES